MNADTPQTPREELEIRLTALLLGELPPAESAALLELIQRDAELAAQHEHLKQTLALVRETASEPAEQTAPAPEPLKLSADRREKLLAHFKTVTPKEFAPPARKRSVRFTPAELAAVLAISTVLAGMSLSIFRTRERGFSGAHEKVRSTAGGVEDDIPMSIALENVRSTTPATEDVKPNVKGKYEVSTSVFRQTMEVPPPASATAAIPRVSVSIPPSTNIVLPAQAGGPEVSQMMTLGGGAIDTVHSWHASPPLETAIPELKQDGSGQVAFRGRGRSTAGAGGTVVVSSLDAPGINGITLGADENQLLTREIKVDPNAFSRGLESVGALSSRSGGGGGGGGGGMGGGGGFGGPTDDRSNETAQRATKRFFDSVGASFDGDGKSVTFNDRNGTLVLRGTSKDLELADAAVSALGVAPPNVNTQARFAEASEVATLSGREAYGDALSKTRSTEAKELGTLSTHIAGVGGMTLYSTNGISVNDVDFAGATFGGGVALKQEQPVESYGIYAFEAGKPVDKTPLVDVPTMGNAFRAEDRMDKGVADRSLTEQTKNLPDRPTINFANSAGPLPAAAAAPAVNPPTGTAGAEPRMMALAEARTMPAESAVSEASRGPAGQVDTFQTRLQQLKSVASSSPKAAAEQPKRAPVFLPAAPGQAIAQPDSANSLVRNDDVAKEQLGRRVVELDGFAQRNRAGASASESLALSRENKPQSGNRGEQVDVITGNAGPLNLGETQRLYYAAKSLADIDALIDSQKQEVTRLKQSLTISDPNPNDTMPTPMITSDVTAEYQRTLGLYKTAEAKQQSQLEGLKRMDRSQMRKEIQNSLDQADPNLTALTKELEAAEQKLRTLDVSVTPESPTRQDAAKVVRDLNEKIDQKTEGVMAQLEQKLNSTRASIAVINQSFEQAKAKDLTIAETHRPYFAAKAKLEELAKVREELAGQKTDIAALPGADQVLPAGMIDFRNLPLDQVLDVYAELTGRTVLRPETLPAQQITLRNSTPLTKGEAIQALDAVLALNGITMVNVSNKVVKMIAQAQVSQQGAPSDDRAPTNVRTPPPIPQPEIQTAANTFSTFSLNVSDVSFKLAAASLEQGQMPEPGSIRTEEFINAFDYRDPEPAPGVPVAFAVERARYPFAHNRDLLRFSLKTAAAGRQAGRPMNIVLLLDSSGSMERADRVRIVQQALRVLASQLQPQDKLSVVTFSRTPRLWVDGIPGSQAGEVAQGLGGLTPEGGTNLEEAMNLAYNTAARHYLANGVNRVVLLTDGAANLGNVQPEALKQKVETNRRQGIALDCFGVGWEGYNDDLLEVLSRNGDGRYGFINSPEEAATEFAGKLAGALKVAASDVKVQVEFNPKRVTSYRQVGYAKHQLTKEQFRDNAVDAAEIAAQEAGNALYTVEVNPAGEGPLATVRVRYKIPGTGDYREQEWAVPFTGNVLSLDQSSAAMRLAATASAFSEWLATSPFAGQVTPDSLLRYLSGVPAVYGADTRPARLESMIRQAKSISGK
jgi:Mg-chelatase subunit ChlD